MTIVQATSPFHRPRFAAETAYEHSLFFEQLMEAMASMRFHPSTRQHLIKACASLCTSLDACQGTTLQERWQDFEQRIWPMWLAERDRPAGKWWSGGVRIAVTARLVQPGWDFLCTTHTVTWGERLPENASLAHQAHLLERALNALAWATPQRRVQG